MGNIIIEEITKKVMKESAKLSVANKTLEFTENEADCESSQDGDCISGPQFVHSIIKEIVEMEESTKQSTGGKQPQMVEAVVAPVVDITMKSVKQSTGGKQPQHVEAVVAPVTELLTKMSRSVSRRPSGWLKMVMKCTVVFLPKKRQSYPAQPRANSMDLSILGHGLVLISPLESMKKKRWVRY